MKNTNDIFMNNNDARFTSIKIFMATDLRILIHRDRFYASQKHSTILRRYYEAFGKMVLCTRFCIVDSVDKGCDDITEIIDSIVKTNSLYKMFLYRYNAIMAESMRNCDLIVCRCESITAFRAAELARSMGKPYLVEAMADAWDAYWNHSIQGKLIAPYMYIKMKRITKEANYAVYVTKDYLQKRYPCLRESISASNVLVDCISNEILNRRLQKLEKFDSTFITLMTTAAVDVRYKGQQFVIKAIPRLNELGIRVKYRIVGEGSNAYLLNLAIKEGVRDQVEFLGKLPLNEVFDLLDSTDIYIQPSLQEGLPRSVIEAMSRGCACIGARTAGIPELIESNFIVKRKSIADIVDAIVKYVSLDISRKKTIAVRNWKESGNYIKSILDEKRSKYYKKIISDLKGSVRM